MNGFTGLTGLDNHVNLVNPVEKDSPPLHLYTAKKETTSRTSREETTPTAITTTITKTAQAILDARALYPDSSLADLYDPLTMPLELRKAHAANDRAVLAAYGLPPDTPESEIVAHLMKLYQEISERN